MAALDRCSRCGYLDVLSVKVSYVPSLTYRIVERMNKIVFLEIEGTLSI